MIKLIQNGKRVAYLNATDIRVVQSTDAEFTVQFTAACKALKTEYLMQSATEIEIDGNRYNLARCEVVKSRGEVTTFSVAANHKSYTLIEKLFDKYNVTGTPRDHMNTILSGTDFSFLGTDISEVIELKVDLTNSRYLLHRLSREFKANIVFQGNAIGLYRAVGDDLALTLTVDTKLKGISRSEDFTTKKVNYRVEVDTLNMQELETISVNDTLRIVDTELGLDDRRKVVRTEYSPILKKNISVEIGDIVEDTFVDDIIDLVEENIELPDNVITEVVHEQVINVETAHILNAWIKNLFVEYLETNMDARLNPQQVVRDYIRIENEKYEMIHQALDSTQDEYLMIPDPNGSGTMIHVYYTAIGDHPDACRYFTITNPKLVHKDLTDAQVDAFKVTVRKSASEIVKYVHEFTKIKMADGTETDAPLMLFGAGTDANGQTTRGKGFIYKEQRGLVVGTYNENNDSFTAILFDAVDCCVKYWDMTKKDFVPFGGNNWIGGSGNVVFHADKTSFTDEEKKALAVGQNALHIGYSSVGGVDTGKGTMMYCSGLVFLGAERGTKAPPVTRYINLTVSLIAFDSGYCTNIDVIATSASAVLKSKTGKDGRATFVLKDDTYTISLSGFDSNKYKYTPVKLAEGGGINQAVSIMLKDKYSNMPVGPDDFVPGTIIPPDLPVNYIIENRPGHPETGVVVFAESWDYSSSYLTFRGGYRYIFTVDGLLKEYGHNSAWPVPLPLTTIMYSNIPEVGSQEYPFKG